MKPLHSFINPVFLLGVAEQFAIAEAKLRAWASIDDDEEDSNDEDSHANANGQTSTLSSQSSGTRDLLHFAHFISFHLVTSSFLRHH